MIATLTRHPVWVYHREKALSRGKVVINDQAPDYKTLQAILRKYDEDISLEKAKKIGEFILKIHLIINEDEKEVDHVK
jgi:hypothetical protein